MNNSQKPTYSFDDDLGFTDDQKQNICDALEFQKLTPSGGISVMKIEKKKIIFKVSLPVGGIPLSDLGELYQNIGTERLQNEYEIVLSCAPFGEGENVYFYQAKEELPDSVREGFNTLASGRFA